MTMLKEIFLNIVCINIAMSLSITNHLMNNCIWYNNTCVEDCPEWMVLVRSNCKDVFWLQQRTCDHPESALEGVTCGFSRCDCPEPMVLDTNSFNCYDADNCPTIIQIDT